MSNSLPTQTKHCLSRALILSSNPTTICHPFNSLLKTKNQILLFKHTRNLTLRQRMSSLVRSLLTLKVLNSQRRKSTCTLIHLRTETFSMIWTDVHMLWLSCEPGHCTTPHPLYCPALRLLLFLTLLFFLVSSEKKPLTRQLSISTLGVISLISSRSYSASAFLIIFSPLLIVFSFRLSPSSTYLCLLFCPFRTAKCDISRTF